MNEGFGCSLDLTGWFKFLCRGHLPLHVISPCRAVSSFRVSEQIMCWCSLFFPCFWADHVLMQSHCFVLQGESPSSAVDDMEVLEGETMMYARLYSVPVKMCCSVKGSLIGIPFSKMYAKCHFYLKCMSSITPSRPQLWGCYLLPIYRHQHKVLSKPDKFKCWMSSSICQILAKIPFIVKKQRIKSNQISSNHA